MMFSHEELSHGGIPYLKYIEFQEQLRVLTVFRFIFEPRLRAEHIQSSQEKFRITAALQDRVSKRAFHNAWLSTR